MLAPRTYLECLQGLLQETQELREAAADEDWEQVLARLEARQALMDQIDAMPAARLLEGDGDLARRLLAEVYRLNGEIAPGIQTALGTIRAGLEESRFTRTTINAYRQTASPGSKALAARFIDRQR
jgi:hypothetical protein